MALRIFEFQCPDGHLFEKLVPDDEHTAMCSTCNQEASRIISAVRLGMRMGVDSDLTTMSDKWAKMHVDEAKRQNAKIDPNPSS